MACGWGRDEQAGRVAGWVGGYVGRLQRWGCAPPRERPPAHRPPAPPTTPPWAPPSNPATTNTIIPTQPHPRRYMGLKQPRLRGDAYYEVIDEFVQAVMGRWPKAVLQVGLGLGCGGVWARRACGCLCMRACMWVFVWQERSERGVAARSPVGTPPALPPPSTHRLPCPRTPPPCHPATHPDPTQHPTPTPTPITV